MYLKQQHLSQKTETNKFNKYKYAQIMKYMFTREYLQLEARYLAPTEYRTTLIRHFSKLTKTPGIINFMKQKQRPLNLLHTL